jgi:hypothetical protein
VRFEITCDSLTRLLPSNCFRNRPGAQRREFDREDASQKGYPMFEHCSVVAQLADEACRISLTSIWWFRRGVSQTANGEARGASIAAPILVAVVVQHGAGWSQRAPGKSALLLPGNKLILPQPGFVIRRVLFFVCPRSITTRRVAATATTGDARVGDRPRPPRWSSITSSTLLQR